MFIVNGSLKTIISYTIAIAFAIKCNFGNLLLQLNTLKVSTKNCKKMNASEWMS